MSNRLIAHLAHVEVLTPKPEESLAFYRDVIGLEESGRAGQSVYLRGWGEWSHHSVQVTEAPPAGHGRAYRYRGPGGQVHELFYDDERYVAPAGMESPFPDRPQRYVPRGIY